MAECYQAQSRLRPLAADRRVAGCGIIPIHPAPQCVVRHYGAEGRARTDVFVRGVLHCNRQWACPVCAAKKAAKRAEELGRVLAGAGEARAQMVTFTVPHSFGESLECVLARVYAGFRAVRTTRAFKDVFAARVLATARAFEVTHGRNGWHAHIHLLLILKSEFAATERTELESEFLLRVPGAKRGIAVVWSRSSLAHEAKAGALYITKLGAEVAGLGKEPKRGNRTPWQIAEAALNDSRSLALWREYQATMKGRRILVLDKRAKRMAERAPKAEQPVAEFICDMWPEEVRAVGAFERYVPGIWWELFEACRAGPDPPIQFRQALDDLLGWKEREAA
jgi:hypothetical protein